MKFLTTYQVASELETIIKEAKKELTLVTPYLDIPHILYQRLQSAATRGVKLSIIYGKSDLKDFENDRIKSLPNLELLFFQQLHAKCYFSERALIITSMNLYDYSEKNNREMGILVNRGNKIYKDAIVESLDIKELSEVVYTSEKLYEPIYELKTAQKLPLENSLETEAAFPESAPVLERFTEESASYWEEGSLFTSIIRDSHSLMPPSSDTLKVTLLYHLSSGFIKSFHIQKGEEVFVKQLHFNKNGVLEGVWKFKKGKLSEKVPVIINDTSFKLYDILVSVINIVGGLYNVNIKKLGWDTSLEALIQSNPDILYRHLEKVFDCTLPNENYESLHYLVQAVSKRLNSGVAL